MASETSICNAALQLIKNSRQIADRTEGSKEANACDVIFDELRDAMLEMHTWTFAKKRVQLARISDAPAFGWDYAYELPSDCLRLMAVFDNGDARGSVAYVLEDGALLTDATSVYIIYIRRLTDPNQMSAAFRIALSKLLASRLAVTLTASPSLSSEMYKQYLDQDLPAAKSADSMQTGPKTLPESDWVSSRHGGIADRFNFAD
jgi:hypothetical protein